MRKPLHNRKPMPLDGEKVSAARQAKRLSQAELAKLTGMSQQAINRIEAGDRANPQFSTVERLAIALDVTTDALRSHLPPRKTARGGDRRSSNRDR